MVSEETKRKVEELRKSSVEFKTVFDEAKEKVEKIVDHLIHHIHQVNFA